ncbi:MAG: agmatine deiminase family protein [Flammeovirgaceae bacterium]|nr:agmatine deiminase family protein [Flammeovirgaceae bacterium]
MEIPYPSAHSNSQSADGLYINFLQLKDFILLPIFEFAEDEKAIRLFEQLYPNNKIKTIDSREISKDGGVLNCITWNIMK